MRVRDLGVTHPCVTGRLFARSPAGLLPAAPPAPGAVLEQPVPRHRPDRVRRRPRAAGGPGRDADALVSRLPGGAEGRGVPRQRDRAVLQGRGRQRRQGHKGERRGGAAASDLLSLSFPSTQCGWWRAAPRPRPCACCGSGTASDPSREGLPPYLLTRTPPGFGASHPGDLGKPVFRRQAHLPAGPSPPSAGGPARGRAARREHVHLVSDGRGGLRARVRLACMRSVNNLGASRTGAGRGRLREGGQASVARHGLQRTGRRRATEANPLQKHGRLASPTLPFSTLTCRLPTCPPPSNAGFSPDLVEGACVICKNGTYR
jgi:hypothetical protein